MTVKKINFKGIEGKWQKKWNDENTYSPEIHSAKKPFYNLMMFPYPSAEGLHAGNMLAFTGSDVYGRFKRMQGYDVFEPMGLDGFGIHAENYAIKVGRSPIDNSKITESNYYKQLHMIGNAFDWNRTVETYKPDYYKWTQWVFIQLFKSGLAYRKKYPVNWCPSCKTVLADEQIMTPSQAGKLPPRYEKIEDVPEGVKVCERCGSIPEVKDLVQWFFRITDYADRLLEGLDKIDWTEKVKIAQRNWIGKSEGIYLDFEIKDSKEKLKVFTTAIETIFGATFMVVSPKHPIFKDLRIPDTQKEAVLEYINKHKDVSKDDMSKEKTGVFSGLFAKHPFVDRTIPIWISDYVLMEYGTGAIMAVPAHDLRDHEFAENYDLPIIPVIKPKKEDYEAVVAGDGFWDYSEIKSKYHHDALLFDSEEYNNMSPAHARTQLEKRAEDLGVGHVRSNYHLRDWIISRQRYWGPPIPMIYCENCAKEGKSWFTIQDDSVQGRGDSKAQSAQKQSPITSHQSLLHSDQSDWITDGWYPEENLPVELPKIEDYKPKGEGKGPLADHPEFYNTECPGCGGSAVREVDVSDTFLDSSWYFLRYPSVDSKSSTSLPFDREITEKWLPVNLYFGGAEHSVLHLMYARFVTMALHDMGYLSFEEPFPKFYAHGLMIKDGAKMSKSRGNVVNPDTYIEKYGADTLRMYLMFMGPMDGYPDFRDTGIEGLRRFVDRLYSILTEETPQLSKENEKEIYVKMNQTIKKVTEDLESFRYNTAISALMELVNVMKGVNSVKRTKGDLLTHTTDTNNTRTWNEAVRALTLMVAPFAPHLAEEIWQTKFAKNLDKFESVHTTQWPLYDQNALLIDEATIAIQVDGRLRGTLKVDLESANDEKKVENSVKSIENVAKWIENGYNKIIFVPGKIINFITKK